MGQYGSNPMIKLIKRRFKKILTKAFLYTVRSQIQPLPNLVRLGTMYGGWVIPANFLNAQSICYLAGAGEDISFDVLIADQYNAQCFIFDPTPRAKIHFDTFQEKSRKGEAMPINNSATEFYQIDKNRLKLLQFHEIGLWNNAEKIKFFVPKNEAFVSHSIVNLQQTDNYIEVEVDRLSNIMKSLGHAKLDLLKLDIEGAEYTVLDTIMEDNLEIQILCVEFEDTIDYQNKTKIKKALKQLKEMDYVMVSMDSMFNGTFIKRTAFEKLKG